MRQAETTWRGRTLRRWYLFETDGRRRVVWAETAELALEKGRRSATAALTDRVEPAPSIGTILRS